MFGNQIIFGNVPVSEFTILNKTIVPPDNAEFYSVRVSYNDGVSRDFTNIPKVLLDIYVKRLLVDGIDIRSLRPQTVAPRPATMLIPQQRFF
jgi:hypothetical protein